MTNSQSVEQDGIVAGNIFAMLDNANRGVNRMKFISLATIPYILPFVKTELGNTWYKFTCCLNVLLTDAFRHFGHTKYILHTHHASANWLKMWMTKYTVDHTS